MADGWTVDQEVERNGSTVRITHKDATSDPLQRSLRGGSYHRDPGNGDPYNLFIEVHDVSMGINLDLEAATALRDALNAFLPLLIEEDPV